MNYLDFGDAVFLGELPEDQAQVRVKGCISRMIQVHNRYITYVCCCGTESNESLGCRSRFTEELCRLAAV